MAKPFKRKKKVIRKPDKSVNYELTEMSKMG
jgi:hypothetical protein